MQVAVVGLFTWKPRTRVSSCGFQEALLPVGAGSFSLALPLEGWTEGEGETAAEAGRAQAGPSVVTALSCLCPA